MRSPGLLGSTTVTPEDGAGKDAEGWFRTGDAGYLGRTGNCGSSTAWPISAHSRTARRTRPKLLENKLKFLPYVREAVAFGDGRDMVCALIDIEMAATSRWADKQSISYTGHADLASRDEVYALIADCIATVNAQLASEPAPAQSQIHRFIILNKELSADDGVLTRTGKLRRDVIATRYRAVVDAMYGGRTEVRFEAGSGEEATEAKIRDAKVVAPAQTRRAA